MYIYVCVYIYATSPHNSTDTVRFIIVFYKELNKFKQNMTVYCHHFSMVILGRW